MQVEPAREGVTVDGALQAGFVFFGPLFWDVSFHPQIVVAPLPRRQQGNGGGKTNGSHGAENKDRFLF